MACPEGQYYCHDRGKCMPIPKGKKVRKDGELVSEVAPPGFGHTKSGKGDKKGGTAAAFKRALDDGRFKGLPGDKTKKEKTASMFKLMWSMKKKGDKPHYKPGTDKKYKKYNESLSVKDAKKLDKASALSQSNDPKDQERARARQTEIDYKDLMDQRKKGKVGVGKSMREGKSWKSFKTAVKDAVGRKTPKHDYGKDAGAEAAKRLRKKAHEKVNFLDPED